MITKPVENGRRKRFDRRTDWSAQKRGEKNVVYGRSPGLGLGRGKRMTFATQRSLRLSRLGELYARPKHRLITGWTVVGGAETGRAKGIHRQKGEKYAFVYDEGEGKNRRTLISVPYARKNPAGLACARAPDRTEFGKTTSMPATRTEDGKRKAPNPLDFRAFRRCDGTPGETRTHYIPLRRFCRMAVQFLLSCHAMAKSAIKSGVFECMCCIQISL